MAVSERLTLEKRAQNYSAVFPKWPRVMVDRGWLYGMWIIGNNFRSRQGYYGEYPPTYLKRIRALFPDAQRVLHLFSGKVEKGLWPEEVTFDIREDLKPDVIGDAHRLAEYFPSESFDLILADPPYTAEDAEHYGTPMIKRNTVLQQCISVLRQGGFLVWLDQVLPMFRKKELKLAGTIGLVRSTNHRFRVVCIFQKRFCFFSRKTERRRICKSFL